MKVQRNTLPYPIWLALNRTINEYQQHADFSVTELIDSVQVAQLKRRHGEEAVVTASDIFAMTEGSGLDAYLRMTKSEIQQYGIFCHVRFAVPIPHNMLGEDEVVHITFEPDWVYRSMYDDQSAPAEEWTLLDLKRTKVMAFNYGLKYEYKWQSHLYRYLLASPNLLRLEPDGRWTRHAPIHITRQQIFYKFSDWSHMEAVVKGKAKSGRYPRQDHQLLDVEGYTPSGAEGFLMKRLHAHIAAERLSDEQLPECSKEERWVRDQGYAVVFTKGQTKGRAVPHGSHFETRKDAELFLAERQNSPRAKDNAEIVFRQGEDVRCERFCSVAKYCCQRQRALGNRSTPQNPFD